MDQNGKTLPDEIHEVVNAQESDSAEDGWLSTNHEVETVSDFEMFSDQLGRITDDSHRWGMGYHLTTQRIAGNDGSCTRGFKWLECSSQIR